MRTPAYFSGLVHQILEEYPDLEQADIQQALEYAAAATDVHVYRLRSPA